MATRKKKKAPRIRFNKTTRELTAKARERVLRKAKQRGSITNAQARIVGKWDQAWYHLDTMRKAGLLKRTGFNEWAPR